MTDRAPSPVKPPQTRDGKGVSAVFLEPAGDWGAPGERVYVKRQTAYWCRPLWRAFRRTPTLRRELRALDACRKLGIPVPRVVSYREEGPTAELVVEEVADAAALDQALARPGADRIAILRNVADVIGRLHRAGWSHGALYADHILVGPPPDYAVVLIDLEKARRSRMRRVDDLERFHRRNAAVLRQADLEIFDARYRDVVQR